MMYYTNTDTNNNDDCIPMTPKVYDSSFNHNGHQRMRTVNEIHTQTKQSDDSRIFIIESDAAYPWD